MWREKNRNLQDGDSLIKVYTLTHTHTNKTSFFFLLNIFLRTVETFLRPARNVDFLKKFFDE